MKSVVPLLKKFVSPFCIMCIMLAPVGLRAQLCTNSLDSIYSMTTDGKFHSININDGNPSVGILGGVAVTNAFNANGVGFSSVTKKFYFFNHCADSPNPNEFVSYDPITKTKVVLANPPAPMTNASGDKIRTGTVNNTGTGYYTILTSSPAGAATFYYYNIGTGTWKIIAQAFKDTATGASMDSMFHNLNSGDMTFDGAGNLWIICSKSPKYALYKVSAPVTTNLVPKLAVSVMIPTRNMPIASSVASITGVAFNSAGKLFFTTGSNSALAVGANTVGTNYNILYRMRTISPLVIDSLDNLPNSYGDDLTSCTYPPSVLATSFNDFVASLQNNAIKLSWKVNEAQDITGYDIEFSNDAQHWQTIKHIEKEASNTGGLKSYTYNHYEFNQGGNYYRIVQVLATGDQINSSIRFVTTKDDRNIYIGPNPAKDIIYIYNRRNDCKYLTRVYDKNGRMVFSTMMTADQPSINISHLPKGIYVLKLLSSAINEKAVSYQFIKW